MKKIIITILGTALATPAMLANPADENTNKAPLTRQEIVEGIEKHGTGATQLSTEQDDLSADVQDLIDEQTDAEIVNLLQKIEIVMGDATDRLEQKHTDGTTIAIETEVIEKIFEAAKKKQKKQGGG
jgi:hypothetical protein